MSQFFIAVFGLTAIFLTNDHRESHKKYASVCGLLSQPFWFYTTFTHEQWGIFAMSFVYAYFWWRGFNNYWIKPRIAA